MLKAHYSSRGLRSYPSDTTEKDKPAPFNFDKYAIGGPSQYMKKKKKTENPED